MNKMTKLQKLEREILKATTRAQRIGVGVLRFSKSD
jgi:hypothetical protein